MASSRVLRLGVGLTALLVPLLAACTDRCDAGEGAVVPFTAGTTNEAGTFYETGPIQGPYLHFPSGRVFEFEHGLRGAPDVLNTYVSFDAAALLEQDKNVAESAGNQAVIECVDDQLVRLRNDTCAEFYVRLTAEVNFDQPRPPPRPCRDDGEPSLAAAGL